MRFFFSSISAKLRLFAVLLSLVFCFAGALAAAVSTLTVKKEQTHLYAQQEERSEVHGQVKMGDQLTPLANAGLTTVSVEPVSIAM